MQPEPANRVNPSEESLQVGPLVIKFLVTSPDSNGTAAIFEMTTPSDARLPAPHSHDGYEETICGIEGVMTWTVDGIAHDIRPGQALCIRRGQVHGFANTSGDVSRVLIVATPALIGPEYFREAASIFASGADMDTVRSQLMALMLQHGLTPVRPAATD